MVLILQGGARAVKWGGFENRCARQRTGGSNPPPPAAGSGGEREKKDEMVRPVVVELESFDPSVFFRWGPAGVLRRPAPDAVCITAVPEKR